MKPDVVNGRQLRVRAAAGLLVLLSLIAIFLWTKRSSRPDLDPPTVLAQVQRLNQLATVKYTVQKVVSLTEHAQPVGAESILIVVQAHVRAGVDLANMRQENIRVERDGSVTVLLPPAQILEVSIDEKETKVWDRRKTWWTPWIPYSRDLEKNARLAGLDAARKAALDMGVLAQAQRNAEDSIQSLLNLAGVKKVVVVPAAQS
jgi:Protein of unknown function (DUF4230)